MFVLELRRWYERQRIELHALEFFPEMFIRW
jgi:hypothetical protein